jgi:DNA ligase-1
MTKLNQFIEDMRATSSSTQKVQIIKNANSHIHKILEYTYNPFKQYYVTSKTCKKNSHLVKEQWSRGYRDVFHLLDDLTNRKFTGHDAIALINGCANSHDDNQLIYKIIDKNLDIRAGDKVINKAVPGLIPTFSVALAQEYKGKCDWDDRWYASRKLDGVRCLAVVDENRVCTLYSRMGKELTTLNRVKEAIENTGIINHVFDGEICLLDENGNEDFQGVMKELRRKDHQIENPRFMIFDMIHKSEFNAGKGNTPLTERLRTLRAWQGGRFTCGQTLQYVDQVQINDDDHFETWNKLSAEKGWEGFMLRKNVGYEGKRSKNLVKVKKFHDAEYEVIDYDTDTAEVVRNGRSETIEMLSQVWIEHKGHKVKVGSGWTHEQRLQYMDGSIVGKIITVQYFEETKNDKGGISLRFPTVKHIYEGKREV